MTMAKKQRSAQSGFGLIPVLIFTLTFSMLWIVALSMTGSELSFVGGRKTASQRFYDAEAGAAWVIDNFNNLGLPATITEVKSYTVRDPDSAADPAEQKVIAQVTIRQIQEDEALASSSGLPAQPHSRDGGCADDSKPSSTDLVTGKLFGVNSLSAGKELQVGVCKEFLLNR